METFKNENLVRHFVLAGEIDEYSIREELAMKHFTILSKRYKVEICNFDATALKVKCTVKQLDAICSQLHCSGIYSEKSQSAIITNFGMYKNHN